MQAKVKQAIVTLLEIAKNAIEAKDRGNMVTYVKLLARLKKSKAKIRRYQLLKQSSEEISMTIDFIEQITLSNGR